MRLWRISNFADLSGRGGLSAAGRWHSKGNLAVYLADHPSTALLEVLVHAPRITVPKSFQLLEVELPGEVGISEARPPDGWKQDQEATRSIGDRFLSEADDLLLQVESMVMPRAPNFIFNPRHPQSRSVRIVSAAHYPFDSRLFAYPDADT